VTIEQWSKRLLPLTFALFCLAFFSTCLADHGDLRFRSAKGDVAPMKVEYLD
jgi:hypothetical protein